MRPCPPSVLAWLAPPHYCLAAVWVWVQARRSCLHRATTSQRPPSLLQRQLAMSPLAADRKTRHSGPSLLSPESGRAPRPAALTAFAGAAGVTDAALAAVSARASSAGVTRSLQSLTGLPACGRVYHARPPAVGSPRVRSSSVSGLVLRVAAPPHRRAAAVCATDKARRACCRELSRLT